VDAARKDLVFRYLDPATGEVATAASIDAIPAAARSQVVVYDPQVQLPPGWDLVADLARGTVAEPRQGFSFRTRGALAPLVPPPATRSAEGAREVVLFSTQGCGYCAKARKFLTEHRIPFTELDVEEDPSAPARLGALGQRAGLGPRELQGVPILFIDGQPVLGWDQRKVASLLGIRG
jgi:glutaredoxin